MNQKNTYTLRIRLPVTWHLGPLALFIAIWYVNLPPPNQYIINTSSIHKYIPHLIDQWMQIFDFSWWDWCWKKKHKTYGVFTIQCWFDLVSWCWERSERREIRVELFCKSFLKQGYFCLFRHWPQLFNCQR